MKRRTLLATGCAALAGALWRAPAIGQAAGQALPMRPIPRSAEQLPIVGIGTAVVFDYQNDAAKQAERREVIRTLVAGGGKLIDTAPAYGAAEDRLGEVVADLGARDKLFLATKFTFDLPRAQAEASLRESLRRLKTDRIDLMQAWNVTDGGYTLDLPREWQQKGVCRYVGITTSQVRSYDAIRKVLEREKPDFVQMNYSITERAVEERLLPFAADRGVAVIINRPFMNGAYFDRLEGKPLPAWAREVGCETWAQFSLKYILSNPRVTVVLTETSNPKHMAENAQAAVGALPDENARKRMREFIATV